MVQMNFGEALEKLKQGQRVTRLGWNGRGMYLGYTHGVTIREAMSDQTMGTPMTSLPFVFMRTAQGGFVPWMASQTDILAEDWEVA